MSTPHLPQTPRPARTQAPANTLPPVSLLSALLAAAHAGPTVAVSAITALLAVAGDLPAAAVVLVSGAVLTGQLTIGWANDLLDAERDRAVGRTDKPIADGRVPRSLVLGSLAAAGVACVALSLGAGLRSGLVHLVLVVAMGQAYNLGLKATAWSWVPYALAFGSLPAVVSLAAPEAVVAPWWLLVAGASLGVGAHLLNALPDLADDEATGVRGLPHRLGSHRSRLLAAVLLGVASLAAGLGPAGAPGPLLVVGLLVATVLLVVTVVGRGRLPFQAAMALALLDVALLVAAG